MNRPLDRYNNFDLMALAAALHAQSVPCMGLGSERASRFLLLMLELTRGTYKVGQRNSALVPRCEVGSIQPTEYVL